MTTRAQLDTALLVATLNDAATQVAEGGIVEPGEIEIAKHLISQLRALASSLPGLVETGRVSDFMERMDRARRPGVLRNVGKCGECGKPTPCGDQLTCDRCTRKLVGDVYAALRRSSSSPSAPEAPKRSVIREVVDLPINAEPRGGCWIHDTRDAACDMCESNANPTKYPDGDAGILLYRADELMVLRAMAPDIADDLARAESAIRSIGTRLSTVASSEEAANSDTERLDWIEECGQTVEPTFEPRGEAWRVIDTTLLEVRGRNEVMTHGATLREAIDRARAVSEQGDHS